jgi:hypothetical protein
VPTEQTGNSTEEPEPLLPEHLCVNGHGLPGKVFLLRQKLVRGWGNYFGAGYPRKAFRQINAFVQTRLIRHLKRRSQRPYRAAEGVSWYASSLTTSPLQYVDS